jgi:hypothetical protein
MDEKNMIGYFPHDSNARGDEKLIALRIKHDWAGYGIYWALIEKLRDASGYKLAANYDVIAYDLRADQELIRSIICDFGLFCFTDDKKFFFSESLLHRMSKRDEKLKKMSEAGRRGNEKRWGEKNNTKDGKSDPNDTHPITTPSLPHHTSITSIVEKSREEESREEKNNTKDGKSDPNDTHPITTPSLPHHTPITSIVEKSREEESREEKNEDVEEIKTSTSSVEENSTTPTPTPSPAIIHPEYKPKAHLPTVDIMREVLKETSDERYWISAVATQHHLSENQVRDLVSKFVVHLASDGVTQKSMDDFKKHFNAWIRKRAELSETAIGSEIKQINNTSPSSREKIEKMKELRKNFNFG